jgi:hypothetical protein
MKQMFNHWHVHMFAILASTSIYAATDITPTIVIRSQAFDKTRRVAGETHHTHLDRQDNDYYGIFSITPAYYQTFRANRLAHCLFGDDLQGDDCSTLKIQGSQVANRDPKAWLADYFYLPTSYDGTITFKPQIKNILADFDFYLGLEDYACGTYLRISAPLVNSRWNLNICESRTTGTSGYPEGYFTANELPADQLLESFGTYAIGNAPGNGSIFQASANANNVTTFFDPLQFARISPKSRTATAFAELRVELGRNFYQTECSHFGLNVQASAPTGSKRNAQYAFESVIGNGHHWELGFGATGHALFWQSTTESRELGFYFDATVSHLFKGREQRTFDLCGKPDSRYMLAMKFSQVNTAAPVLQGSAIAGDTTAGIAASALFDREFAPVANLTTLDIGVSVALQADIVAWFNYTHCNWSVDVGYNFWGRTSEHFSCPNAWNTRCACPNLCTEGQDLWALKGDARVYGFDNSSGALVIKPLSATQSNATIHAGTNGANVTNATDPYYNLNYAVDNPLFAQVATSIIEPLGFQQAGPVTPANQIKTSIQPLFINCKNINIQPTRGISHKLFAHASYDWECECITPYCGLGGSVEFGSTTSSECTTACDTSSRSESVSCALSQWGIWIKGGIFFE